MVVQNEVSDSKEAPASTSPGSSFSSPTVTRSNVNKRKRPETPDFLDRYLLSKEARESEKEERRREKEERREQRREQQNYDNYLFALGLIPALRRLSPAVQSSVKIKIHQLLHDAEFGQSSAFFSSPVAGVLPSGHPADPNKLWLLYNFLATLIDVYYMHFKSVFLVFFYIQEI